MKRLLGFWGPKESEAKQKMGILQEKMGFVTARKEDVNKEIENAEIHLGKIRRLEVAHWLHEVEQKEAQFESIEEELRQQGSKSSNSQLFHRIQSEISAVQWLLQQGAFPNGLVLDDYKSRSMSFPVTALVGEMFSQNIEEICEWLKSPNALIGVYGMGGVGKTTLLKHINNHLQQHSISIYWVTVSQDCSLYKLQQKIFHAVTAKDLDEEDEERRTSKLCNMLRKKQNIVLILDDIWEAFDLDRVGISPKHTNCKIIMSSRSLEVCRRMRCRDFVVQVQTLSEDEAWKLFADSILNYKTLASEVKHIATLVAKECGRLPLAIITVAGSLRDVYDMHEWRNALNELRDPNRTHDEMQNEVFLKLKFSYDRLKDEKLQFCFLSCVLYHEDDWISREELIEMWINEGLLDEIENKQDKEDKGHTILNKLVNSCLLESTTDWKYVKMHDLVRDMGITISRSYLMAQSGLLLKQVPEKDSWTEDLVKVSLSENQIEEIPCGMSPCCPKLRVLMLDRNPLIRISESFFLHMTSLTILDLSDTLIGTLPEAVSNLENLRAFMLRGCFKLLYVPSLAKLTKLRVLDLPDDNYGLEAPKGMEKLKHLEKLPVCRWNVSDLTYYNRVIESSSCNLQGYTFSLFGRDSFRCLSAGFEYFDDVDNKVTMSDVYCGPDELTTMLFPRTMKGLWVSYFDLTAGSLNSVFPNLGGSKDLKTLEIKKWKGLDYILSAPQEESSKFVTLSNLKSLILEDLPDLRGLISIRDFAQSEEIIESSDNDTNTLKEVPKLYSSPYGVIFHNLKQLKIKGCPKIKVVFPGMFIYQHQPLLPNIEEIEVLLCNELEEIFESSRDKMRLGKLAKLRSNTFEWQFLCNLRRLYGVIFHNLKRLKIARCPKIKVVLPAMFIYQHQPGLPNLEEIQVCGCSELEEIFESSRDEMQLEKLAELRSNTFEWQFLCNLRRLEIVGCDKMKAVLSLNLLQPSQPLLPNLKTLIVSDCDKLEVIFALSPMDGTSTATNNPVLAAPKLSRLDLKNLPNLHSIFRELLLSSLATIYVEKCPKLELNSLILTEYTLPTPMASINSYTSLTSFSLSGCDEIKEVFPLKLLLARQLLLPNLDHFWVKYCKDVEVIFASPMGSISPIISFPKLKALLLIGLPKLVSIYRGVLISSSLLWIRIEDCPKLKRLPLSESVICDESPATLASIPTCTNDPQWWELLYQHNPQDALMLSNFINQAQTPNAKQHDCLAEQDLLCRLSDDQSLQFEPPALVPQPDHFSDEQHQLQDRKRKRELGSCLSLSLLPDYNEETHGKSSTDGMDKEK